MYWDLAPLLLRPSDEPLSGGRIIAEVGFGNGEFLAHLASREPDAIVVGFEVSQICVAKAARRALASGLTNVRIAHGDARFLMSRTLARESVEQVWMNFPCPWPKKRHADRRVTGDAFARALHRCLAPGGAFSLATDVLEYAEATDRMFADHGAFKTHGVVADPPREYLTKYERKWREMGRATYAVTAVKVRRYELDDEEDHDMTIPETELAPSWPEAVALMKAMKGDEISENGYTVLFKEIFVADAEAAIALVITVDEGFEQHFYIKAVKSAGAVRGKIDSVGHPYRTPGVRAALRHMARKAGVKF